MALRLILARIAALIFGVSLALGLAEAGLRLAGFEFHMEPEVRFGWPDPQTLKNVFVTDPDLIWVTRDYGAALRGAGSSHPAVVFLGDSCTQFGTYPRLTLADLHSVRPDLATGVKLGVAGWSSEQGRVQLRRDVVPLAPRVVTIYYGWNDHWMALGPADHEILRARTFRSLTTHSRLAQMVLRTWFGWESRRESGRPRVPLARYRENLAAMVREARDHGIAAVLITAPAGHEAGHEPEYLARAHLRDLHQLVPLHQQYVQATRDVAGKTGATLCDAAAGFALDPSHRLFFQHDGIHLSPVGDAVLSRLLTGCIVRAAR